MTRMETGWQIRLVIVSDHRLFREGIRLILGREVGIAVLEETVPRLQTTEFVSRLQPDVVLLDTTVPGMGVVELIRRLNQSSPATKLLLLIPARDDALILEAMKAGAKGYLSRDATAADLAKAIQAVHHGELWVERKLTARLIEGEAVSDLGGEDRPGRMQAVLTSREQEILRVLASGATNKEIARALFISEKTVKCHLNHIFQKLHVTRRLQAVLYAVQCGVG